MRLPCLKRIDQRYRKAWVNFLRAFFLLLVFVIASSLIACEPSCEEQGGRRVYSGTIFIPQKIGSVTMMQQYPQYKCVFDK